MGEDDRLAERAINTIRTLAMDAVQKANSGHPGLPMGAAPMAYVLWQQFLRHNPKNPQWPNRDRFVLSAGHGSMLIYALLHLTGYDLPLNELIHFRQWGSRTPGHPENHLTPGVETTTGPLGQGAANAVGMALAGAFLAEHYNRPGHEIVDHDVYALVSDGDLMEGVASEAVALAGHWGLDRLVFLYDDNEITLDGKASMTLSEDMAARFAAQGWHTLTVRDGNDLTELSSAIHAARDHRGQPTLICIRTIIGFGSPNKAGTSVAHGSPLGEEEVRLTKAALGWPTEEPFYIPGDVLEHYREAIQAGNQAEQDWQQLFAHYQAKYPDLAEQWQAGQAGQLPADWDAEFPIFPEGTQIATRNALGEILNAIAPRIPTMIGGDADLAGSTKTLIQNAPHTDAGVAAARNVRFGVREHGMGAIVNGLALTRGITRPYSATFLQFSDYMRAAIRLGALMEIPALYIFSHDSIGLGEDGPTHQPVEHVMSLRLIPQLYVFRPADGNEVAAAFRTIFGLAGPAALITTRQNVPTLPNPERVHDGAKRGGYILAGDDSLPDVILLASGSEVSLAYEAYLVLTEQGISSRVVSLPCWELFDEQEEAYREHVLPHSCQKRVSIEAGVTMGWQRYIGTRGIALGVDRFGASAPYQTIYKEYGLTAEAMVQAAKRLPD
ncbi:MAG: transketolase [Chloroflexi bacterium]|nr:transketolase [Chloroflexota bacterium]